MLRCSSKRAFSSTRQTVCLPSSAAAISAGTIGDSSLVRYTVVFSATTSRSAAAPRTNASKLPANESYGWWTSTSPRLICVERSIRVARRGETRRRAASHGLGLQVGARERRELRRGRRGRGAPRRGRSLRPDRFEAALEHARASASRSRVTTSSRTGVAEAPPAQLVAHRLEQVGGVVGDLEVGVARDAEERALDDLHLREEPRQEVADRPARAGRSSRAVPTGRNRGSSSGTLTRAKRSSPVSGSRTKTPRLSERPEMYGNGWPGPTASGVSTGKTSASKSRSSSAAPPRRSPSIAATMIPASASAGRSSRFQSRAWRAVSSSTRSRISASASSGVRPSGERTDEAGLRLLGQARRRAP